MLSPALNHDNQVQTFVLPVFPVHRLWFTTNVRPWLEVGQRRFCIQEAADPPPHADLEELWDVVRDPEVHETL